MSATVPGERAEARGGLRSAWRHRPYRFLLASFAVSATGDWLYGVAMVVYVFDRTGSSAWVAAAVTLRVLPYALFGPLGGVIADRYDRRAVMITFDLIRAAMMVVLAAMAGADSPVAAIIAIAFLASAASTPFRPAVVATTPSLVGEADLAAANAAEGVVGQLAWFAGPALGALLLTVGSVELAFLVNGLTFLVSAVLIARLPSSERQSPADDEGASHWLTELRDGLQAVSSSTDLLLLNLVVVMVVFVFGFELVLYVLVAENRLGMGAQGVGYLTAAIGIGGLMAAPLSGRIAASRQPGLYLAVSAALMGAPMALLAIVDEPAVAFALLLSEGVGSILFEVLAITTLQRLVASEVLARVFGVQDSMSAMGQLLGSLLAPILVGIVGLEVTLALAGGTLVAFAVLAGPRLKQMGTQSRERIEALRPTVDALGEFGLFDGASRAGLEVVALRLTEERVKGGATMIVEGDQPDDVYLVRKGTFNVYSSGEMEAEPALVNVIGAGSWFGEIGLIESVPRTGTVVAAEESLVWRIPGEAFLAAVTAAPFFPEPLRRGLVGRLAVSHPSHVVQGHLRDEP